MCLEWVCVGGCLEKGEDLIFGLYCEVWEEVKCVIMVNYMIGIYIVLYVNDFVVFFDVSLKELYLW